MTSQGINEYSWDEYEKLLSELLELDTDEIPQAFDRDHDEIQEGKLSHVYNVDIIQPSGHDWIGAETVAPDGSVRLEFLEPVVHMADRTYDPILEILPDEEVCIWCHLTKMVEAVCPNCN